MVDIMEEFEKDRKEEKRFYAHINFFKLMIVARICQCQEALFVILDGTKKLDKLIQDIEEENIVLKHHSLYNLYEEMTKLSAFMSNKSQSTLLLQAEEEFKLINKQLIMDNYRLLLDNYDEWDLFENIGVAGFDLIVELPHSIAANPKVREALLSPEKQKTLGERK